MPYPSRELLRLSLEKLEQRYSPLLIVSIPCMLAKGVPTVATGQEAQEEAIPFGAPDEKEWLDEYFRFPGGPGGNPYYQPSTGSWVQERYPGRSLQRQRKQFEADVFHHPDPQRWAFRESFAEVLRDRVLSGQDPVSLAALMIWMWRDREMQSVEESLSNFVQEYGFDRDGLIGMVYSKAIPGEFRDAGFRDAPLTRESLGELIGAQAPPPKTPKLTEAAKTLEEALEEGHYVYPPGLVERIVGGWLVGDIAVLVGPTGSGKTFLANLLAEGLEDLFGEDRFLSTFLEIGPDYDVAQFIGYENLAGEFTPGRFANEALFVGEPSDPRLVVLDEWNLAQIDAYFAPILSAIETGKPQHLPGDYRLKEKSEEEKEDVLRAQPEVRRGRWMLPEDAMFLATCNSWMDEPETRLPISGPVKRRCRIIPMPNVLAIQLERDGRDGLREVCNNILAQEQDDLNERRNAGHESVWDEHRGTRLDAISTVEDLPEKVEEKLLTISRILLENPTTESSYTVGVLGDVLLSCVYAQEGKEYEALGHQIADKVLHQVSGDPEILEVIHGETRDLPNAKEIEVLVNRMGGFSSDRRIKPLV